MSELPICSRFVGEREASEAVSRAAVQEFIWAHGERRVLLCSGRAAVSGCCRPGLHATQHYSSPNATVLDCRPKFGPAQWTADDGCVEWPGIDSCRLSPPQSHGCRKKGDDQEPHRVSSSSPLPVDQRQRQTQKTGSTWRLAAGWMFR